MQIGAFAKLCGTKISVLRHYDKTGLLHPDYTDRFTGYRYYAKEQMADFLKISALKAAGFSQHAGHRKEAAELYRRVAEVYGFYEPIEREFYLALAALCLNDRTTALRHFENAHKLNPGDENIRKNIEILRKHQPEQH